MRVLPSALEASAPGFTFSLLLPEAGRCHLPEPLGGPLPEEASEREQCLIPALSCTTKAGIRGRGAEPRAPLKITGQKISRSCFWSSLCARGEARLCAWLGCLRGVGCGEPPPHSPGLWECYGSLSPSRVSEKVFPGPDLLEEASGGPHR